MDQKHKQRLVGGIVLLALGLILVPTILDFSEDVRDSTKQTEMPEPPDVMKMEVLPLEIWSEPVNPDIDDANRIVETPAVVEQAPANQSVAPETQSSPAEMKQAAKAEIEEKGEPKPEPDTQGTIAAGASAWVVQVASFSDEPKAFKLRDSLRAAGHPTFVERGRGDAGVIYRVKVGPVLQRSEADKLKQQVAKETKLDGLVMQYR